MVREKPVELDLAKRLREDEEFRTHFFRTRARKEIASQIRELREKADLRQSDLAERCEMKQSAISRIEQADYSSWNYKTLLRVAEALNTRLRIIFEPLEESIRAYEIKEGPATTQQQNVALRLTGAIPHISGFGVGSLPTAVFDALSGSSGERHYIHPIWVNENDTSQGIPERIPDSGFMPIYGQETTRRVHGQDHRH